VEARFSRCTLACGAAGLAVLALPAGAPAAPPQHLQAKIRAAGSPVEGQAVRIVLRVRAPRGARLKRYWIDFGDGSRTRRGGRKQLRVVHRYRRAGRYRIKVRAVDTKGHRTRARRWLRVGAAAAPEPAPEPVAGPGPTPPTYVPPPIPGPPEPEGTSFAYANWVEMPPGSAEAVTIEEEVRLTAVSIPNSPAPGVSLSFTGGTLAVETAVDAEPANHFLELDAVGCIGEECDLPLLVWLPVTVVPLEAPAGWIYEFSTPSAQRVEAGSPLPSGGVALTDELIVTLGTSTEPGTRAEADVIAAAVGAVVSGGFETVGIFELRWTTPQDLEQRRAELLEFPAVSSVSESTAGLLDTESIEPDDWSDDGAAATWPFTQVRAQEAWETTQGTDVTVGIVDQGAVYRDHEDLDVETVHYGEPAWHATHVAGLACAKANGIGLVGVAWGCPIVSSGLRSTVDKQVLAAMIDVATTWGVRVVNMSLGYNHHGTEDDRCATAAEQQKLIDTAQNFKGPMRRVLSGPIGRSIVWTISAGNNCAAGVPSPWGANANLANVITVAAVNSDRKLASFSDFGPGVEVAAPGGVGVGADGDGTVGLWSTWHSNCGLGGWFDCGGYGTEYGTSMAAPVVAGIAALVRSAHPGFGAVAAAECITATAGEGTGVADEPSSLPADGHVRHVTYSPADLPIVDAKAAVECDTFGPVEDSDYIGHWGATGYGFEVVEESPGVLGVINEAQTTYPSGCSDPPGQRILTGMSREPDGQWSGEVIASFDCTSHTYYPVAAMRIVRGYDGAPNLVLAWASSPSGERPTIDVDGTVTSSTGYYESRLGRNDDDAEASALRGAAALRAEPGEIATPAVPGAKLRPPTLTD
jgi:subtilisin family serine protease